jgi:hypothetical protein
MVNGDEYVQIPKSYSALDVTAMGIGAKTRHTPVDIIVPEAGSKSKVIAVTGRGIEF